ncbi:cathepsin L-like [Vanessa atalanta]|uniref:cathepsin L-like n=1 Tax=Vanessa atalanta TaxID=42275 RepID=UPI001FCD4F30|nr:cathepsin L-like [Vanessa atalanta]
MRSLALLLVVVAVVGAESIVELISEEWDAFKHKHQKSYENETEEQFRMKIYAQNKLKMEEHNRRFESGQVTYRVGVNKYADMMHHEFVHTMNGFNSSAKVNTGLKGSEFVPLANVQMPYEMDWRSYGAVTNVKDQGQCDSCWAFSTTGSVEGQHFRSNGYLESLSEQNLVDCSGPYGNYGCEGGFMGNAFRYIIDNGGIDTENSYPYEAVDDICRFDPASVGATITGYVDLPSGDEETLQQAVGTVGPISIAIDDSQESFQFYADGVYYDENCSSDNINHAMLAVGYGMDQNGGNYWLVKNSWGTTWGDLGYIKMARNQRNHCGIATYASYPLV